MGLPCATLDEADLDNLMGSVELDPEQEVELDIEANTVTSRAGTVSANIPDGTRTQLLEGTWDAMGMLLDGADEVAGTAERLPYINGFAS